MVDFDWYKDYEVMKLPYGRWVWTPILGLLDFIPKGARRPTESLNLSSSKNTFEGAVKAAAKFELSRKDEPLQ